MLNKANILFNSSECPSEQTLRDYQAGILSTEKNRLVENHLADCEMCSDYVEGLSLLTNADELDNEAQLIVARINKRTSKKNKIWLYAIAASLLLAIAFTTFILLFPSKNTYVADDIIKILPQKDKLKSKTKEPDNLSLTKDGSETYITSDSVRQQSIKSENKKTGGKITTVISDDGFVQKAALDEQNIVTTGDFLKDVKPDIGIVDNVIREKEENNAPVAAGKVQFAATISDETKTEKVDEYAVSESKSNKKEKAGRLSKKTENSKSVGVARQMESPIQEADTISTAGLPAEAKHTISLNSDLDKANKFLNNQQADSAVLYALRGINSGADSSKWKSKLCLAKAYILLGQKEKAVVILKEVKEKATYNLSKDADAELEKLGY